MFIGSCVRSIYFTAIYRQEIPMEYLIIFFAVVTILLIAALAALIFILCKSAAKKIEFSFSHTDFCGCLMPFLIFLFFHL